jgi:putative tryptophan/tyrosine transport system substrate-binding protein
MRRRTFLGMVGGLFAPVLPAQAQPTERPLVGFLSARSPDESAPALAAFREGLGQTGYFEGRNVALEYRWAEGQYERLPALARELADRPVAVIAATGGYVSAEAAKHATTTIPVVFISGGDVLKLGLVSSFSRPDGNLTGVNLFFGALGAKQLELLRQMAPAARDVAMLTNPRNSTSVSDVAEVTKAAGVLGLTLHVVEIGRTREIDHAVTGLKERGIGAVLVGDDPFLLSRREQIIDHLNRQALPAVYFTRDFVAAGGLMSYGASSLGGYRQAGLYVGAILKGARPSELPVIQPTAFALTVNLRTARTIGLEFPVSLLVGADEVIE